MIKDSVVQDISGNTETIYKQDINAIIMNGNHKGDLIKLQSKTSDSEAYDLKLKAKDEIFIEITRDKSGEVVSSNILDLKRDKYISYIFIIFLTLIIIVGGAKGLRSLTSVIVNIVIFSIVIELYLKGFDLILVSIVSSFLFIILSISIVTGINRKSFSAILGMIIGTIISMLIAVIVILFTKGNGIHYEEMEFLTRPPEEIFIAEIIIGTLGGIMDIAISISSAIKENYGQHPSFCIY
ncbi:MAG TPA: YibE/F family protein [Clostridiaceae bacterium]